MKSDWPAIAIALPLRFLRRFFSERQLFLRSQGRVRFVTLSPRFQMAVAGLATSAFLWVLYASTSFVVHDRLLAGKDRDIRDARLAYLTLLEEFDRSDAAFTSIARALEENQTNLVGLSRQNAVFRRQLKGLQAQLRETESAHGDVLRSRQRLAGELRDLNEKMRGTQARNHGLTASLRDGEETLRQVSALHIKSVGQRDKLQRRIGGLENRLGVVKSQQQKLLDKLTRRTLSNIAQMERMIARTGIDIDKLLAGNAGLGSGRGGPFIDLALTPATEIAIPDNVLTLHHHIDRWDGLKSLLSSLPLTPPVDHFYLASRFGKRRDPFNGRWAIHSGVDLAGVYKSPVLATAPGKVVFAGWKGRYGRMIEIDHGMGLHTRYGHLARIIVKKGQAVGFRDRIGLMGNSGRSTGPHVHYEVHINGIPRNPKKFLDAGKHVFKG